MEKIETLCQLNADELRRVRRTLVDRFRIGKRGNVVEVGFGVAESAGQLDRQRTDAICFYVTRKCMPRSIVDRIPSLIDVRVKRGRRYLRVLLPSDVIELAGVAIQLSGRPIRHLSVPTTATAGAIVVWRFGDRGRFAYGVLTVGHLFWNRKNVPEPSDDVRIRLKRNRQIIGRLMLRSKPGDGVDAAIVLCSRSALIEGGVLPDSVGTRAKKIRAVDQLTSDRLRPGWTLPRSAPIPLMVLRYLPEFNLIPELGPIRHALHVRGAVPGMFRDGTSGSPWIIEAEAACQQFAGWESSDSSQDFVQGTGQSTATIMQWCRRQIATTYRKRIVDTDLRLIREL